MRGADESQSGASNSAVSMVQEAYGNTNREQANRDLEEMFRDVRTNGELTEALSSAAVQLARSGRDAAEVTEYAKDFCELEGKYPDLTLRNIATPLRGAVACVLVRKNTSAAMKKGVVQPFHAGRLQLPEDVDVLKTMVRTAPGGISHLDDEGRTAVPVVVNSICEAMRDRDFSRAVGLAGTLPEGFGLRSAVVDAVITRENLRREVPSA
ncbi:MAG: hypothetical protein WC988_00405 [Patescibacteria group bacterium]